MTQTCGSDILTVVCETAEDLHGAGIIEKRTLRRFGGIWRVPLNL